ncbi:hypothetical protein BCR61_13410 [Xanthomonas oryzae pv. oryzae]|nr:hypothetical protein BCR61_13410 [Xanthomonas oryzae pv. oryzae]AXQ75503.1 hypothetical protein BXU03_13085 [Xanthomonas oryzae pv. oryzae]UMA60632.1 hypothetical protein BXU04_11615 [Xanthomonas oryzae pv. oryzae]UWZ69390.1 hypothetical protein BHL62_13690 [Xanthomonas oryzae pv. oryzae]
MVFAGTIQYNSLGFALRRGYATATTDGGHRGSAGDASFALNHPQKIIDWGTGRWPRRLSTASRSCRPIRTGHRATPTFSAHPTAAATR